MRAVQDVSVNHHTAANAGANRHDHAHARALERADRVLAHGARLAVVAHGHGNVELFAQDAPDGALMHISERAAMVNGAVGIVLKDETGRAYAHGLERAGARVRDVDNRLHDFFAGGKIGRGVTAVDHVECIVDQRPLYAGSTDVHTKICAHCEAPFKRRVNLQCTPKGPCCWVRGVSVVA